MNHKVKEVPKNYIGNLFTLGGSTFFIDAGADYKQLSNKEHME
ncbi:hypothetical protein [Bacillus thuringiensis]|nr:hypothetical protein [Bacillus thuringiensis]